MLGSYSAPVSAQTSPVSTPRVSFEAGLRDEATHQPSRVFDTASRDLDKGIPIEGPIPDAGKEDRTRPTATTEAHKLVRAHTQRSHAFRWERKKPAKDLESGSSTPVEGETGPTHEQIRAGVLSSLLKLYNHQGPVPNGRSSSAPGSPTVSGRSTPKWYNKSANNSVTSLLGLGLMGSSQTLMAAGTPSSLRAGSPTGIFRTPKHKKRNSGGLSGMLNKMKYPPKSNIADEIRITIHIAKLLQRQKYVLKLCRALMLYGAPTHRLEEYVKMTCAVLEIDAQCLYIPGCMVISFDDPSTHTSDMRIVRVNQGCDLSKLHDTHLVYKTVVHDLIGVEEGTSQLDDIMKRPPKHPAWALVFVYGLASALVGPFAFQARPIDMPICFLLGCILGVLQLIVAPKSDLYTNVLEISATIIMSFFARMFGSIRNGELFCFSALAQSSIALILPGYIILCGSLELQSKNLVAGSVRMFYAIIYSLFLGFGITVGAALYGALDPNATSATTCKNPMPRPWSFLFVPLFALCLLVANQAKWRQAPVMVAIATAGFTVNYFSVERFANNPQVVSGLGALAIGILGNLYSRVGHGLAFAAMLPAVFVLVPSGLAAQGSIVAGIKNADALAKNYTWHSQDAINSTVLNLGFSMIQISIGLTVGLFATVLLLYPIGKKRSGLFTF
ncbi:DUF1212-domain-containing protein [Terfezia boudieri ATCC MYA-4762]|uniref:DUF1212-domain-containing protein n=1 Tax=Terfezia boudieri ATCC MYA-4762 TaxID=1051890 RepID=A0A3N4LIK9_9PEZI|nr:DUF1212-domain-containing protein [Terfezia boudieri ATCC MYA-4762]